MTVTNEKKPPPAECSVACSSARRSSVTAIPAYLQQNPPGVELTFPDGNPTVTFTGVLAQSATLAAWTDLAVTSPYTVPAANRPGSLFFRVRR